MVKHLLAAAALLCCVTQAGPAHPLARGAGPSIEDLARLVELGTRHGGLSLSPDGRFVAAFERRADLTHNDYRYALVIISTADGAVRTIADAGGFIASAPDGRRSGGELERTPAWSPDGQWIAFVAERGEHGELWRARVDGADCARMAVFDGDVKDVTWLGDGRLIVDVGARLEETAALAANALRSGYRLDERLAPVYSLAAMPADETRSFLLDASGETTPVTAAERRRWVDTEASLEPRIVPREGAAHVHEPPVEIDVRDRDGAIRSCLDERCSGDVRNPMRLANGDIAFLRLEGFARGDTAIYVWRPRTGALRRVHAGADMLACVADVRIYCLRETAAQPRMLVEFDPTQGAMRALYDPNAGFWQGLNEPRIERLDYTDVHDLQSYAHLVFPYGYERGRRYPLVIVQYRSRGFLRGGTGGEYPIYPFAAAGYFVLSVERPEDHARARQLDDDTLMRENELSGEENRMKLDAIDAFIARIEARRLIDPDRIAITGMSDGSETLYLALLRHRFAAAVASTPPTDRSAWWLQSARFRSSLGRIGAQPPWSEEAPWRDWWDANSIAEHAREIATPLLFNLTNAEAMTGLPLYVRLREQGTPTEIFLYPDAYHLKWRPVQLLAAQERAMAWIQFWTNNVEIGDVNDPDRIGRWRALREISTRAPHMSAP